jgi:hypothetical protein
MTRISAISAQPCALVITAAMPFSILAAGPLHLLQNVSESTVPNPPRNVLQAAFGAGTRNDNDVRRCATIRTSTSQTVTKTPLSAVQWYNECGPWADFNSANTQYVVSTSLDGRGQETRTRLYCLQTVLHDIAPW